MKHIIPFRFGQLAIWLVFWGSLSVVGFAQITKTTDGTTPPGIAPGAPIGAYPTTEWENVNLFNGQVSFTLPIAQGSRGGTGVSLPIRISRHPWVVKHQRVEYPNPHGSGQSTYQDVFNAEPNWWGETANRPFLPGGSMIGRYEGADIQDCSGTQYFMRTNTRLTFTAPDGTEYNLIDKERGGNPRADNCNFSQDGYRGSVFITSDGTSATFYSVFQGSPYNYADQVYAGDPQWTEAENKFYPSGSLMLKDGTRYDISGGRVTRMRDRNGNEVRYDEIISYVNGYPYVSGYTITDTLKRQIVINFDVNEGGAYGLCDRITIKGFGGADRILRISYDFSAGYLRTTQPGDPTSFWTLQQMFPQLDSYGAAGGPRQVSAIWLPDNRSYKFKYNVYQELARVELPTGGALEYDYAGGEPNGTSSGVIGDYLMSRYPANPNYVPKIAIYRRLIERRVYTTTSITSLTGKTTYSKPTTIYNGGDVTSEMLVEQWNPSDGSCVGRSKHYFLRSGYQSQLDSLYDSVGPGYLLESREYRTNALQTTSMTELRKTEHTWSNGSFIPNNNYGYPVGIDPRITESKTTLSDSNQVTKQTFTYGAFNNPTDVYEYDYGTGTPGALVRRSHTDFVTVNPVNSVDYANNANIHIRNLPSQTQVFDAASNKKAETKFEYDDYSASANHAALVNRTNISGFDTTFSTSYNTRGNVTKVSQWRNTDNAYLNAYSQYDIVGNGVKAIDANGNATTIEFDDRFGYPNGEAQSNSTPPAPGSTWLNGQTTFAVPTKVTNALGHIAYTQVDYFTGKPVDTEDPNNIKSSLYYDDVLDRPTKGIRGVGTSLVNQTLITYDDANRTITTATDKDANTDSVLQSKVLYDGLGRTYRTAAYEGSTWAIKETQFDALGRAYRSSNPFRDGSPTAALPADPQWTTSSFDALSRVTQITTPDTAHVDTSYLGNTVTVTDQAGKNRKSETDALGRLKNVGENPTGLNYQTSYSYDTLDNLTTVTQGAQTRSFAYDSLKRLTLATNPESGATSYTYDNNGNLIYKVDALNRMTWYPYDALNRSLGFYTNQSNTHQVVHVFDTATNGKGKFGYNFTTNYWVGGSTNTMKSLNVVTGYDALGRVQGQHQYHRNAADTDWGNVYTTSRTYDLAGNVKSQTYPSGRVVNYDYNAAGQMTTFKGNLGDGTNRVYASEMAYNPAGQMTKEAWGKPSGGYGGMTTTLYQNKHYNNRLQLYDIRLGTSSTDEWTWNRGGLRMFYDSNFAYGNGGTNNNGNVYRMDHFVPTNESATTFAMSLDYYGYDALNRITGIWENKQSDTQGETSTGLTQQYVYDRFGNRTVNNAVSNFGVFNLPFNVDQATNRLLAPNGTISYDAVGNQINDSYTGAGNRTYDANNKLVSAATSSGTASYQYNANGSRISKTAGGVTTWMIYGLGGELVAEYLAYGVVGSPQKEYGYRGGQMLVVYDSTETGNKQLQWLVQDHLGSTRMVADLSGSLTGMKRHDYLPFGEEIGAGVGIRTAGQGYPPPDDKIRQKFTSKERDVETGLDYFLARYVSSVQGRFTSPDVPFADQVIQDPQSWNLYNYVRNNSINFIDPDGRSTHTNKDGVVVAVYDDDDLGVYQHDDLRKWNKKSKLTSKGKGVTNMGATEYINEFAAIDTNGNYSKNKDGSFVVAKGAKIRFGESFDGDISRLNAEGQTMSLKDVANSSTNGNKFDIKVDKSIAPDGPYTGKLLNGKYASARSAGNYLAGFNGATSTQYGFYVDYAIYANMAGALQTGQWEGASTTFRRIMIEKKTYGPPPYYGEQEYSGRRIRAGFSHGVCVRNNRPGC